MSAVINVGTATLAALIGAGGYGVPIITGLAINNYAMIYEGAGTSCSLCHIGQSPL